MKYVFLCFALLLTSGYCWATWSIIIINQKTGEIGIAGASCTHNCSGIGRIIPGQGAIIVQAMSNADARRKGAEMIQAGYSPDAIIEALQHPDFGPEHQQYAVVTCQHLGQPRTYTGTATSPSGGSLTATGVSIQGNTLADEAVLTAVMQAVVKAQSQEMPMAEILMLALEAGSEAGGDKRCGEQRATCAFIRMAIPTEKPNKSTLFLEFFGQKRGGMNAVHLLRGKYERWKTRHRN
ncbi:DUF1028 domain-containing protein [Spirosoma sp. BT702]|uniref:DUF1028 domain-containing protein n=1 Tax=Spirosoma profusum TaxID=2771354 RepID=A0A927AUF4_9BACT|nr:DUF1028 domain-containing protein [Spirosoma profusum]MBD2704022.1 DUF1028 domain-containing protein [Spirosoma profusum]